MNLLMKPAEEDRNRFIKDFVSGLRKDPLSMTIQLPNSSYTPVAQRATSVCRNICVYLYPNTSIVSFLLQCIFGDFILMGVFLFVGSLLRHADFLITNGLDVKDLMMFR